MQKVFLSKRGWVFILPVWLILGAVTTLLVFSNAWPAALLLLLLDVFIVLLFLNTRYTLNGNDLHIQCGWIYKRTIPVNRIRRIEETNNPLSAPATSLDRLALILDPRETILISPEDKEAFIRAVRLLQPQLEVKYKRQVTVSGNYG